MDSSATPYSLSIHDFAHWRVVSRRLASAGIHPSAVHMVPYGHQELLFSCDINDLPSNSVVLRVPKEFIELAQQISYHSDISRWNLLYHALWEQTHEAPHFLSLETNAVVYKLRTMEKQVRRDCHKMKAFVRFRRMRLQHDEYYVAWHHPDHHIVQAVAPFFSRRFKGMKWSIFTPNESAHWDGCQLAYGPGVARSAVVEGDDCESLWKTYYSSIFNPARIKLNTMKREMPVRHWPTLPEAELIDDLLADAPRRVDEMVSRTEGLSKSAADYIPPNATELTQLSAAADHCEGCDLCLNATQTVFGSGSAKSKMVIVGEQPGNEEDLAGMPFVGPAGRLLNQVFDEIELDRSQVYVTNAVKHFSFEQRGKIRLHKKPTVRQITACKPWLNEEIRLIRPDVLVCMGATALQSLLGRDVKLTNIRGQALKLDEISVLATWHPAAILRSPHDLAQQRRSELKDDLKFASTLL